MANKYNFHWIQISDLGGNGVQKEAIQDGGCVDLVGHKSFYPRGAQPHSVTVPQLGDIRMVRWKIEVAHVEVGQVASQSLPQLHACRHIHNE